MVYAVVNPSVSLSPDRLYKNDITLSYRVIIMHVFSFIISTHYRCIDISSVTTTGTTTVSHVVVVVTEEMSMQR